MRAFRGCPGAQYAIFRHGLPRAKPGEQAIAVNGPREDPAARVLRGKAEEAIIIDGVADQHQRLAAARIGVGERGVHQLAADPLALATGANGDGPDEDQGQGAAVVGDQFDRPALDGTDQLAVLDRRKAEIRDRVDAFAQPIGGALATIATKGVVEKLLDIGWRDGRERKDVDQLQLKTLPEWSGAFSVLMVNVKQIRSVPR